MEQADSSDGDDDKQDEYQPLPISELSYEEKLKDAMSISPETSSAEDIADVNKQVVIWAKNPDEWFPQKVIELKKDLMTVSSNDSEKYRHAKIRFRALQFIADQKKLAITY